MNIGQLVTLTPKTRHGKNVIHQFGACFQIIMIQPKRILIKSDMTDTSPHSRDGDLRWVDLSTDQDFNIQLEDTCTSQVN